MTWRLLRDGPADGPTNMATDEALLVSASEGGPPTLRLYQWSPPTLSIGAHQRVDRTIADPESTAWVRRPSGGRAVWHDAEVTYAIAASADDRLMQGGVRDSYRRIARGLAAALRLLGVSDVTLADERAAAGSSAACYDAPSDFEILASGRKVIGSAQLRRGGGVLQHGSIPIRLDLAALLDWLPGDNAQRQRLRSRLTDRAAGLADLILPPPSVDDVMDAVVRGLAKTGVVAEPGALTVAERGLVRVLVDRYRSIAWRFRK